MARPGGSGASGRVAVVTDQHLSTPPADPIPPPRSSGEAVVEHTVRLVEEGPFTVARCDGCGWRSFARRSRPLARSEGQDHEVLHRGL